MQPNLIRATAESSLTLLGVNGRGTPEALLLAWVAWEGLKVRTLVVGMSMQGWKVQDIYDVLSEDRVHSLDHVRGLFKEVFGSNPENARGIGQEWRRIEDFREVRNRYVHGARGADPMRLEAGTHLITDRVLDPMWLSCLPVVADGTRTFLGDPYRRLPGRRTRHLNKSSLKALVRDVKRR